MGSYRGSMSLSEIEKAALDLPEEERRSLITTLRESVGDAGQDEEVMRRVREMEAGLVEELSHEELKEQVQAGRHPR